MKNENDIILDHVMTLLLTIQVMSLILMFFFGWLGTKMELPNGIVTWWLITSLLAFGIQMTLIYIKK